MVCTRSVRRVTQVDAWMQTAQRSSFRQIGIEHRPLLLWHMRHHIHKFCFHSSSLIYLFLCHLTVTCTQKSNVLAVLQPDLDSTTFGLCVWPLHMHNRIIMSPIRSLKSGQSWHVAELVQKFSFTEIWPQEYQFASLFLRRRRSHHHDFVWIQFLYYSFLGRQYAGVDAYEFNRLRILTEWLVGLHGWRQTGYTGVGLLLRRL